MRKMLPALALLPLALFAGQALADECLHSEPRNLQLDLTGIKSVLFDIGPHELVVNAAPGAKGAIQGKACASDPDRLKGLTVTQRREGDRLVVTAERESVLQISFGGSHYGYLVLNASVPDNLLVHLKVGSGDARVTGASALSADVGSGEVEARNIRGQVTAEVNSGEIELDTIGSLHVLSVGSGDLKARRVKGGAVIGSIGSGAAKLRDIGGDVSADKIGSGDLDANNVAGNLTVRKVGSGSVDHSDVRGRVDVPQDD
ncbi:hypothetical protein QLQ15_12340 [Lysobacter sp. LF1]|uniref:Adhesin domain-containing protein n=1 Tax=Lysobacter stagni TaxID=3045172 RepID=A0ABT6XHY9_9GAMM|nr:hypothetical protein [Lysobacter sp. LF1]MDI9239693.1 hypothetical protein [Lysobacter sp. LF1]